MSSDWPAPFQPIGQPPQQPPARASRWPLVLLIGGIVAAVVLVAVIVFLPVGGPTPSPTPSLDIAAQIQQVFDTVPAVRQLQPTADVPWSLITRDQFVEQLRDELDKEIDPAMFAAQERLLKRLGLLDPDIDLRQLVVDLNGGAVAAFYRPDTKQMYLIQRDAPFGPLDRVYVAHEYTHALQDQHFDLEANRIVDPAEADAALAQLAVIEGDATDTMLEWAQANLTPSELVAVALGSLNPGDQPATDQAPAILNRELLFPYTEGTTFATQLQAESGWDAVNEALQHPPESSEQILHPEKYAADERPAAVVVNDASAELGAGWQQSIVLTLGELDLQVFVAGSEEPPPSIPGLPGGDWPHSEAAAGWNGDRLAMWESADQSHWAIAWVTAWDTPADATEFADRLVELEPGLQGAKRISRGGDLVVTLLVASEAANLDVLTSSQER